MPLTLKALFNIPARTELKGKNLKKPKKIEEWTTYFGYKSTRIHQVPQILYAVGMVLNTVTDNILGVFSLSQVKNV